jgi:hypothetical protein
MQANNPISVGGNDSNFPCTTEIQIGSTLFIVNQSFNGQKYRDVKDTLIRLISQDCGVCPSEYLKKSA